MEDASNKTSTELESAFLQQLSVHGRLTPTSSEQLRRVQHDTADHLAAVTLKLGILSEADLSEEMISFSGLPRLDCAFIPSSPVESVELNVAFLRAHEVLPLAAHENILRVGCWDALDEYAVRALRFASGCEVELQVGTRSEILQALDALYPLERSTSAAMAQSELMYADEEIDRLKDLASEAPVIRLVQRTIIAAVAAKASDIHLEPTADGLQIRFRTDGMLREVQNHSRDLGASVVSRIKVMAGLDIAERRLPQDGRIRVKVEGKDIDFRVATSPTLHGESVVLRILDRQDIALDFDALGFDEVIRHSIREAISRPHGIVLVTGPTGSGKTTTLYAALKEINTPDKKILTVEDPVEYMLQGVNQVPVKPQIGLTFANALRAFLRQDPDVLMVGEIRDRETAEIAIQAALTGHLLLSTLHTNSAAAAITRLLDMGIDDYLLTSTLHLVLGQRLVRRLCTSCRQECAVNPEVLAKFAEQEKISSWYRAVGCAACQGTGYKGRTTIVEALVMTDEVRAKVLAHADANAIEKVAIEHGMRTMFHHGLLRVSMGMTSFEEVKRVTSMAT